ncbi:hypothetical protein [Streptomyces sp. TRM49041]|uniref:hypothetical protein n=1 Tax=Streptomyces sp. TRM49041 TaxID=2603216 RepID=UPI0011EF4F44|nr:hypothetical protein [Streptomyces sp. TRM49041]
MRLFNKASLAVVAALAAAGIAAPLSLADPGTAGTRAAARPADPGTLLATPDNPRVSDGAYAGFQFCAAPRKPVVTSGSATLAATLEAVAPPGTVEKPGAPGRPGRRVVFEVERANGERVLRRQLVSETSQNAAYQLPRDELTGGDYRWRVRVQDGPAVSEWTAWCDFTVRGE